MFYFYFKVPVSQFHQLRYNVAYVLKEMEDLEKKSILKIQDWHSVIKKWKITYMIFVIIATSV